MATIKVLEDLMQAYQDYPHVYLELTFVEVEAPGNVANNGDDLTFRIRAINRGPVNMKKLGLRVTGLNGTQVKSNGAAAPWSPSFELSGDYFGDVPAHNADSPVMSPGSKLHFKPTSSSTVARDLMRVEVTGWDGDDSHLLVAHTRADPEAKAIYSAVVSPA
jgi:hypothetical protein